MDVGGSQWGGAVGGATLVLGVSDVFDPLDELSHRVGQFPLAEAALDNVLALTSGFFSQWGSKTHAYGNNHGYR